ncbi:cell division protein SepF [Longivirga aurantiaca]|uniref:Cell division protein SepF n=1 Tax=Longivirga aurantiaca TaxID=1837743 RepID=A0ABW1T1X0_9ACTN
MGAMRKMAVYLGLVEDEALEYAADDDYADARPARDTQQYSSVREVRPEPRAATRTVEPAVRTSRPVETPAASAPRASESSVDAFGVSDFYRITTLHPRTYNDARRIGEEFREGVPVIMNLTEMDDTDAKRIVDFAAGLVFGCRGTIERVTNKVFLLSPANVDVAAEAKRLAQDGFFNQS